jgi:SAM-dependent methyltransferase
MGNFEERIIGFLEGNHDNSPQTVANAFDKSALSLPDRLLLQVRARSFDPKLLADGINNVCTPPKGNVQVLDVGCNIGAKTKLLIDILQDLQCTNPHIIGIDLSKTAIALAQELNNSENVEYVCEDFLTMDIEPESMDYVFLAAVWHHIKDTRAAIEKIEESLKPNGVAIIFNGFYPEQQILRILALLLQRLYRFVEKRHGLYYTKPLVSDIRELTESHGKDLSYKGDFKTGFPTSLFNTRMLILQKRPQE